MARNMSIAEQQTIGTGAKTVDSLPGSKRAVMPSSCLHRARISREEELKLTYRNLTFSFRIFCHMRL